MTSGGYTREQAASMQRLKPDLRPSRLACRRAAKYDGSSPPRCRPTCDSCVEKWIAYELSAPFNPATK